MNARLLARMPDHGGTVADGKDIVLAVDLKRVTNGEETGRIEPKAGVGEPSRRCSLGRDQGRVARQLLPARQPNVVRPYSHHGITRDERDAGTVELTGSQASGR